MRLRLSQLRRIIKEEADRFIAESYSGDEELPGDSPPANRGDKVLAADAVILAISKALKLARDSKLTPDDLRGAFDKALREGTVDELSPQADEINALLQSYR